MISFFIRRQQCRVLPVARKQLDPLVEQVFPLG